MTLTLGQLQRCLQLFVEHTERESRYAPIVADLIERFGKEAEVTEETMALIKKRARQQK